MQRQCIKAWHEKMSKRVRISNDSLNSYGSRVLTSGMSVEQYCRNPVLLYMHQRGNVIGYVKDLRVEDGEVTGELVFDEATDLSKRCKKQFEFGSLRMVSAGIDILELSDQPEHLLQGQTSPTITKSKFNTVASTGRFIQVEDKLIPLINFRFMILNFKLKNNKHLSFIKTVKNNIS